MNGKEKTLESIIQLRKLIATLLQSPKSGKPICPQKAIVYLTKLSLMEITWEMLKATKIGYSVNDLRKLSDNLVVQERGKRLLKKWKALATDAAAMMEKSTQRVMKGASTNDSGAMRESRNPTSRVFGSSDYGGVSSTSDDSRTRTGFENENGWTVRFVPEDDRDRGLKLVFARNKST